MAEYDADVVALPHCATHGHFIPRVNGYRLGRYVGRCPTCTQRGIGKSAHPNNLIYHTTHSSEEARRSYLKYMEMVTLMERKRYEVEHGLLRSYMYE